MFEKRGQQEIVGFVLIVVLVVMGLMFFLLYSLRDSGEVVNNDLALGNLLGSLMVYTSDCVIDFESQTVGDLFVDCYEEKKCDNNGIDSCVFLGSISEDILNGAFLTESRIDGLVLDFYEDDSGVIGDIASFKKVIVGNCSGSYLRSYEMPMGSLENVYVSLSSC
jgi:hypothetical protein